MENKNQVRAEIEFILAHFAQRRCGHFCNRKDGKFQKKARKALKRFGLSMGKQK